jgi:hypothetical protein
VKFQAQEWEKSGALNEDIHTKAQETMSKNKLSVGMFRSEERTPTCIKFRLETMQAIEVLCKRQIFIWQNLRNYAAATQVFS